ncbi:hypothetical protein MMC28_010802 [Mycoblastus sanguinarius]|nr:hypothetical protein [Mycoblastus sanguinarius]
MHPPPLPTLLLAISTLLLTANATKPFGLSPDSDGPIASTIIDVATATTRVIPGDTYTEKATTIEWAGKTTTISGSASLLYSGYSYTRKGTTETVAPTTEVDPQRTLTRYLYSSAK